MKKADVIVIGGSAAGVPAAITARRHYPDKNILLVRKEEKVLIPCGIPYIFGTVGSADKNLIPDAVLEKNSIELCLGEAIDINTNERTVSLKNGEHLQYDKIILALGSKPTVPPIPGIDKENVFPIKKDISYLNALAQTLDNTKNLVVLGCGFIGVEFADECKKGRDINVTVIEALDHCLQIAFGNSACRCCEEIEETLTARGIKLLKSTRVQEVLGKDRITAVKLSEGREIQADAMIVGIGVTPNIELAQRAGLTADASLGISVDKHQRTSDPHIFACGDCAAKQSFFTGQPSKLWLASIAVNEARIAGANLFETQRTNQGVVGVFSTAVDGLTVGMAGLNEDEARECGFDTQAAEAEAPNRHPGTMPGMRTMWVRLIFNRSNRELLGGAVCGGESAGELINTISACIQNRMTADDIATFQIGTHPAVTASPIVYQLVDAAEIALARMKQAH